ncbi:AarF/ABC1/UbiB kinase family protein [Roseateles sp. DAIF2]|uniref:ABC1 kinase family protein n=1 Tax=Roseateles sp. DAIF2 TaxID=2714952 RepID=UPI0018A2FA47|nr:AarF/ABC1/UbiB kinase family protein [Roseateles sp. DAIF2]QPF76145.1 AarF/ABC1/UbiB kinase family protein [Roseateles sp. DAIF2]
MNAASKPPRTSRLARGAIAGGALARAGVARLSQKAQDLARDEAQRAAARAAHEAELGRILFGALNQLKGVALKAAQLLSCEAQLLPEALREQLARACYQATPMNQALVGKRMRQALGPDWAERFAHFEPQAFAAASLGQVHRARLADGCELALKLQYPGIAATVASDMRLLRGLLLGPLSGLALGEGALPDAALLGRVLDEIEAGLAAELDYAQEARAMDEFRAALAPRLPRLAVPEVCHELSTPQLLAMQALPGLHLAEWLAGGPGQAERDRYGQLIFDAFMVMVFELGRLHADPHPGNYLFMPDGRLGLLDFGCTRALPRAFVTNLARAWSAGLAPDGDAALREAYLALGLIDAGLDLDHFRRELRPALAPLLDWQLAPFRVPMFDFGARAPLPHLDAAQQRQAMRHLHGMPPELPYLDRAFLGLNQLLARLGARVRTRNPWIGGDGP